MFASYLLLLQETLFKKFPSRGDRTNDGMLHCPQVPAAALRSPSESSWARTTCRLKKEEEEGDRPQDPLSRRRMSSDQSERGRSQLLLRRSPSRSPPVLSPLSPHTNSARRPSPPPSPLHPRPGQTRPSSRKIILWSKCRSQTFQWQKERRFVQ